MKRVIQILLLIDMGIVMVCLLSGSRAWLFNSQIGFISASLVMFASIVSYRNMVQHRLNLGVAVAEDNRDTLEKIEDPYDLFDSREEEYSLQEQDFKRVVEEEKHRLKKSRRSLWQVTKDSKAALSLYRLGAYGLLILGFFYLNHHQLLDIPSYLFGLSLPPLIVVLILIRQK